MPKQVQEVDGEPFRYWVESSQDGMPHFVDLVEYGGNGECSCPHFRIRCQRLYKDNGYRVIDHGYPNATRCKHINTALLYLASTVTKAQSDKQKSARKSSQDHVLADGDSGSDYNRTEPQSYEKLA